MHLSWLPYRIVAFPFAPRNIYFSLSAHYPPSAQYSYLAVRLLSAIPTQIICSCPCLIRLKACILLPALSHYTHTGSAGSHTHIREPGHAQLVAAAMWYPCAPCPSLKNPENVHYSLSRPFFICFLQYLSIGKLGLGDQAPTADLAQRELDHLLDQEQPYATLDAPLVSSLRLLQLLNLLPLLFVFCLRPNSFRWPLK